MRKIILLISLVLVFIAYVFPGFILPIGEYKGETKILDKKIEYTMKFSFNGKVKTKTDDSDWNELNYDIKDGYVYISEDEKYTDDDIKLAISNIYTIDMPLLGEFKNNGVKVFIIGMLIVDAILVITMPKKKKNK